MYPVETHALTLSSIVECFTSLDLTCNSACRQRGSRAHLGATGSLSPTRGSFCLESFGVTEATDDEDTSQR